MNKEIHSWAVAEMCRASGRVQCGGRRCWRGARECVCLGRMEGNDASHRQADSGCGRDFVHFILRTQSGLNWNPDIKEFFQQPQILPV